ncbi:TolC family protein [Leeia sp. TBRC 13508]|uniref:TolC family protein n=1 Tax=Leeia speluncae TaxID=2884804 RepID=A0ABS8D4D5_9NEIS|nr:TolC family protein [Leeia speluncae]MCB6182508.1 TolC family protein [Leeia speluncae]
MYKSQLLKNKRIPSLCLLLLLTGCASQTFSPVSSNEISKVARLDIAQIQEKIEPLSGPLSLNEAIARAMKYNLDRRVKLMEQAIAVDQYDLGNYDLLPKVVANAGYRTRDSDLISKSRDSVTGDLSTSHPYISSDRNVTTYDLTFTWSLLDFGQSYYIAKQNADRVLIAGERRRKAMQNLVQDVSTAFWKAASAQRLKQKVKDAIQNAEDALDDARKVEAERLRPPMEALRYQRQVLENLRLLETIDHELSASKTELAALTGLPLSANFDVVEPERLISDSWLAAPMDKMETIAMANNPDFRESFYGSRIAVEETKKTMLRMFPGLTFTAAAKGTDDSYQIYKQWQEAGIQVSYNLLGLFSLPAQKKMAEDGVTLAEQRRKSVLMATLAQVHIAFLQYQHAFRQYQRADSIWSVDAKIADLFAKQEQVQKQSKMDSIANQTTAILSELRRYQALAVANASASKLRASLGMEPVVLGSADMSIQQLSVEVGKALDVWERGVPESVGGNEAEALILKEGVK